MSGLLTRLWRRFSTPAVSTHDPIAVGSGALAEQRAAAYLEKAGLSLRQRNYRSPHGEIDLVMEHGDTTVFVEVRYRRRTDFGAPAETVDARKQRKLRATAEHFLQRDRRSSNKPCRFDIVAVTQTTDGEQFEWLRDAF